jgi:hypothetical protein
MTVLHMANLESEISYHRLEHLTLKFEFLFALTASSLVDFVEKRTDSAMFQATTAWYSSLHDLSEL